VSTSRFWAPYDGAVSLTFDDGTQNQLDKAVPALDVHGLRGTFYLNPTGENWHERLEPWVKVAASGHEIGNHTVSHLCSHNYTGMTTGLEDCTLAEVEADILLAQERLVQLAPHQKEWTFAYPCYNTFVGRGISRQSYVPVVARRFLAGRVGGEYGFANQPQVVDLASVWGLDVQRMSGFEMVGLVEELTFQGQWLILVFHEIDGQRLTVGSFDYRMLLRYLERRRETIWTAPVVEVARKIAASRNK